MGLAPAGSPADLLAPVPLSGVLVGYGRVSTREQNLSRQQAALSAAGCAKSFFDKATGKNTDRPELARMLDYVRPADGLVVVSLDRLGRSLEDLIRIVGQLKAQGVGFHSLHERLDTTTPGGMFIFHVFAALAEFIRTIIVNNTNEGLAAARTAGHRIGRLPAFGAEKIAYALQLLGVPVVMAKDPTDMPLTALMKRPRAGGARPEPADQCRQEAYLLDFRPKLRGLAGAARPHPTPDSSRLLLASPEQVMALHRRDFDAVAILDVERLPWSVATKIREVTGTRQIFGDLHLGVVFGACSPLDPDGVAAMRVVDAHSADYQSARDGPHRGERRQGHQGSSGYGRRHGAHAHHRFSLHCERCGLCHTRQPSSHRNASATYCYGSVVFTPL
ncbi:recombinase family protein [Nonomuraea sp. NPDC049152]|uniref:recombinase family protein n=1 Tax=Nonomuraea sp. NPDC049152 TaxID=3154350 RepID=UPI0033CC6C1D